MLSSFLVIENMAHIVLRTAIACPRLVISVVSYELTEKCYGTGASTGTVLWIVFKIRLSDACDTFSLCPCEGFFQVVVVQDASYLVGRRALGTWPFSLRLRYMYQQKSRRRRSS